MLIEFRIGPGKDELKSIMQDVRKIINIKGKKIPRVPHMTLYGPFVPRKNQTSKIIDSIISVGRKYDALPFTIDGLKWMDSKAGHGKVIYFNIVPSEELKRFRFEVSMKLLKIAPKTQSWDKDKDFVFHITLAYRLTNNEFNNIWYYLTGENISLLSRLFSLFSSKPKDKKKISRKMHALRITLLNKSSKIICEYDLIQKRKLSRNQALSKREWIKTLRTFNHIL